jgi:alpha-L-fucosidase
MAKSFRCIAGCTLLVEIVMLAGTSFAQTDYQPTPENLKARREFQDAKFGMFIHWGVYSVLATANGLS